MAEREIHAYPFRGCKQQKCQGSESRHHHAESAPSVDSTGGKRRARSLSAPRRTISVGGSVGAQLWPPPQACLRGGQGTLHADWAGQPITRNEEPPPPEVQLRPQEAPFQTSNPEPPTKKKPSSAKKKCQKPESHASCLFRKLVSDGSKP